MAETTANKPEVIPKSTDRAVQRFSGFVNATSLENISSIPVQALFAAQAKANTNYLDYLQSLAFDKEGKTRTVNFKAQSSKGGGEEGSESRSAEMTVPLMSIVTHPCIGVRDSRIEYFVEVVDVQEDTNTNEKEVESGSDVSSSADVRASASGGYGPFSFSVSSRYTFSAKTDFRVKLSSSSEQVRKTDTTARFNVVTNVDRVPPSETLAKVMENLMTALNG